MTYEDYLDEVTTLITEKYDVIDEAAIEMVMRAQGMMTTLQFAPWSGLIKTQVSCLSVTNRLRFLLFSLGLAYALRM
jgi:hypothetical protein